MGMTDDQLLRYSRHILLEEIGIAGQTRLLGSHALIVGAGGLGSAAALYLGAAGVGRITLMDDDHVDLTNLQRQIAHTRARIGSNKAHSAAQAIAQINPDPIVTALAERANATNLAALVPGVDLVLDCSDNFATRQRINQACMQAGKPLISGAAVRMDGQLAVFDPRDPGCACYACVFPPDAPVQDAACATMGVLSPLVGTIGTLQAAQAIQLLVTGTAALRGKMAMLSAWSMDWQTMALRRDAHCPVCSHRPIA
jgi:molybdopterin/thiamine biosynthesis adenylyltransferase